MRLFAVFVAVLGFCLSDAMPFNDCRDHYELCGPWAKGQYCELSDYKDYMNLVCPYSCGLCDEILSDLSASGQAASDTGSSDGSQDNVQRVIPEVNADFESLEERGSTSQQSEAEADHEDERPSLSGSGEEQDQPLFRATATKEAESRLDGEAEQQDESGDQQESISSSGGDRAGANFWAVVRVEPDAVDGGSERELHLSRRSEKYTLEETIKADDDDEGSASGVETSGDNVSQKSELPFKSSSGDDVTFGQDIPSNQDDTSGHDVISGNDVTSGDGVTSGENASQRSQLAFTSASSEDVASGEDDAPFDTSSTESELDSGCSSGDGCYASASIQGEEGGDSNPRSMITKVEEDATASGSARTSGDSSNNIWLHPHFDVPAGPYDDKIPASGAAPLGSGSGVELGNALHDIEDAIFETGVPLEITRDDVSGSGLPSPPHPESQSDSPTSGSESGEAEKEEDVQLYVVPQHHAERISLIEKMMKQGQLQAFKVSHMATVEGTSRDQVPGLDLAVESDLGKGRKVSFVLNQDFHDGYANENSAAYDILANSVKKEVENVLGSNAVVSKISFSEVREPAKSPRFSKVLASLKLLGDVTKLEKEVNKGALNSLIVDKEFFHAS